MTAHWKLHLPGLRPNTVQPLRSLRMLSPFPVLLLAMWLLVTACLGMVIYIVLAGGITKPVIGTELPLIAAGHPLVTEMRL